MPSFNSSYRVRQATWSDPIDTFECRMACHSAKVISVSNVSTVFGATFLVSVRVIVDDKRMHR